MKTTTSLGEAIRAGYIVLRSTSPAWRLSNAWFRECEGTGRPFVRLFLKTRFVTIEVDLIGQTWRMTPEAAREIQTLLTAAHAGKRPTWQLGDRRTFVVATRIPTEIAGNVATAVVDILTRPPSREPAYDDDVTATPMADAVDLALAMGLAQEC